MRNAIVSFPCPANEPVKTYLEGSPERIALDAELERQYNTVVEIPLIIGGKEIFTGNVKEVVCPHEHGHVLARYHQAGEKEIKMAIEAALAAHKQWAETDWTVRASIILKCAELLATKYRPIMNAATMLGQSKNIFQAEIDSACETIDFFRYNVHYASKLYAIQPKDGKGFIDSTEYRPLEGFVLAVTPFNFTSIASNLNMTPILLGNTTVWKPSGTAVLSNYYMMKMFEEAGVPAGVVNFVPSKGSEIGRICCASKDLAGIHFTGSTATFQTLWKAVGENIANYVSYPRLVGETGGKDYIFVHPSAVADEIAWAAFSGAYEYQGQKCSAASRMYVPKSMWPAVLEKMKKFAGEIGMGDVRDPQNYINAVIDETSWNNIDSYLKYAEAADDARIVMGGGRDKSVGYFVEPTVIETTNPHFKTMEEEIFGPVLTVYPYDDDKVWEAVHDLDTTSPYGLTGSVFGRDRLEVQKIVDALCYTAGNFYINDRPTGAVVGMQPFGGSRASGTNDKAGGEFNLIRWVLPRCIKETLVTPTDYHYSYMKK
ncbi:MAG: L-glutamate gamma-semialdehyde dehydrogenase [Bacteroidia bacterium]|nr:L-glutamate gamma-semialdehyde dehydrogenase [Bacteroidia bacterium]